MSLRTIISVVALLAAGAAPALAQRTVTKDAGGGRKIVLHYNAADQVVQTDTLGPNGEMLEKDVLEYRAGAYVPQSISTSYWPNGKVHKITQNSYDNNSNFLGEFVQVFDDAGKQMGGHRLTHDPQTNIYTCADWNTAAQNYKPIQCPAGEESSGTPETVKKFTQDEVVQQLSRARQTAQTTNAAAPAAAPSPSTAATTVREVGLILPSHIRVGERVSGSVVNNPADFEGMPEITVTRLALPFAPSGRAATLAGWALEMSGEPPQPADGPIALTVPPGQVELAVLFRQADNAGAPVSKAIPLPQSEAKGKAPTSYIAPAICIVGQLCMVRGPFSGNSAKTFAIVAGRPAKIVAETTTAAYVTIPAGILPGSQPLIVAEGSKAIAFPVAVTVFGIAPDRRDLPKGEKLLMYATIEGPEDLPDPEWLPGNFPPANLAQAQKLIPGYKLPHANKEAHEAAEKREAKEKQGAATAGKEKESEENLGGEILLVVKNPTPDVASFRESKDGTFIFHLPASAFKMGEFKYKFVVDALKDGKFGVQGYLIPFLAPVTGQEFTIDTAP